MGAIPNYKDIVDLIKKGATLEAQEKIMGLRASALELQEENIELRKRISELGQQSKLINSMEFRKPFYFLSGDEHPHCPVCWEKDKVPLHLTGPSGEPEWFTCPVCKWSHAVKPDRIKPHISVSRYRDRGTLI